MLVLASLGLALLLSQQTSNCPDCRNDPRRPLLCSAHLEAETTLLREQRALLARSKDIDERLAAIDKVAALTRAHANVPSPVVARFLADALRDESLAVRRSALARLLDGQHHDETVRGVLDGWKEGQKLWRVLDAKLVLSEGSTESGKAPVALTTEELSDIPDYTLALIRALGRLRDERAWNALHAYFRAPLDRTPGRFLVAAADSMLQLDSRKSCDATIALLAEIEDAFVGGQVPRRFAGDQRTDLLASLKAPLENASEHDHAEIVALLAQYATLRNLAPPESEEPLRAADWKAWLKLNRDALPEKIGAQ
ncbi:MAG: hypothetical protein IT454_21525 [Planctomycetes bacterium]|nr:hypothetical protein [Planctomycetota bacterium]